MNTMEWAICLITILGLETVTAQELKVFTQSEMDTIWKTYTDICNKKYTDPVQNSFRRELFFENFNRVNLFNQKGNTTTYQTSVNCKSDWTKNEFKLLAQGYNTVYTKNSTTTPLDYSTPPTSFDWRDKGLNKTASNQGMCASSWAIAAATAVEYQCFIKTGKRIILSKQEMLDCVTENAGCNSGRMDFAFRYMMTHGISSEGDYPTTYLAGECLRSNTSRSSVVLDGYLDSPEGSEFFLMRNIVKYGPMVCAVDSSNWGLQQYKSGVYSESECSSFDMNVALTLVGYGRENNTDFWIAQAPYGQTWGENGYIRIARNKNNHCGIATDASVPILKSC